MMQYKAKVDLSAGYGKILNLSLSDCVTIQAGYPFRGALSEHNDGEVEVIQAKDISDLGELKTDALIRTKLTGKRDPDCLTVGDIIFTAKGSKNIACYLGEQLTMTTCAPSLFLMRVRHDWEDKVNPEFIAWQLNQAPVQNYFKRNAEGSFQLSIRRAVLASTRIALPNIEIQNTIVKLHNAGIQEMATLKRLSDNHLKLQQVIATDILNKSKQHVEDID